MRTCNSSIMASYLRQVGEYLFGSEYDNASSMVKNLGTWYPSNGNISNRNLALIDERLIGASKQADALEQSITELRSSEPYSPKLSMMREASNRLRLAYDNLLNMKQDAVDRGAIGVNSAGYVIPSTLNVNDVRPLVGDSTPIMSGGNRVAAPMWGSANANATAGFGNNAGGNNNFFANPTSSNLSWRYTSPQQQPPLSAIPVPPPLPLIRQIPAPLPPSSSSFDRQQQQRSSNIMATGSSTGLLFDELSPQYATERAIAEAAINHATAEVLNTQTQVRDELDPNTPAKAAAAQASLQSILQRLLVQQSKFLPTTGEYRNIQETVDNIKHEQVRLQALSDAVIASRHGARSRSLSQSITQQRQQGGGARSGQRSTFSLPGTTSSMSRQGQQQPPLSDTSAAYRQAFGGGSSSALDYRGSVAPAAGYRGPSFLSPSSQLEFNDANRYVGKEYIYSSDMVYNGDPLDYDARKIHVREVNSLLDVVANTETTKAAIGAGIAAAAILGVAGSALYLRNKPANKSVGVGLIVAFSAVIVLAGGYALRSYFIARNARKARLAPVTRSMTYEKQILA